jgi:tRNA A37 threonylcarbamoyladenosine biosynthesis protein TsaE
MGRWLRSRRTGNYSRRKGEDRVNEIVILGGPNGAGKTTAARVLLREFLDLHTFVNADELARGINSPTSDLTGFAAGCCSGCES